MIHYWKSGKQKLVYDTASGAIIPLTSLEYKMVQAILPPLSPLCPSSLRYELAKFDSADVEEAYDRIYCLFQDGILFALEKENQKCLRIGSPYGLIKPDEVARDVVKILGGAMPTMILCENISKNQVEEIRQLFA